MSKKSRFTKDMNDFQRYMFGRNGWNVQLGGWIKYLTDCTNYCIVLDMPWGDRLIISQPAVSEAKASTPWYKVYENICHVTIKSGGEHSKDHDFICTFKQLRHEIAMANKRGKRIAKNG